MNKSDFLVITSKEYKCPHCKKEIPNIQKTLWLNRICEHLRYHDYIKIRVTKGNIRFAEAVLSILKDAFMIEEADERQEIKDKNLKTKQPILVVEIVAEKIPAIRR